MGKVFKGIKKVFKKVVKLHKKLIKKTIKFYKKYGKYIAAAVAIYFTAGAALSMFSATGAFAAAMPGITSFTGAIGITGSASFVAANAAAAGVVGTSVAAGGVMGAGTGASAFAPAAMSGPGAMAAGAAEMAGGVGTLASTVAGTAGVGTLAGTSIVGGASQVAGMTGFQKGILALQAVSLGSSVIAGYTEDKPYENSEQSIAAFNAANGPGQAGGIVAPQITRAPMPQGPRTQQVRPQSGFTATLAQNPSTSFFERYKTFQTNSAPLSRGGFV